MNKMEGQVRIPSGCAISAVISRDGKRMTGEKIIESMRPMHDRSNGLGGGFAAYGIYPEYKDFFALHMFLEDRAARKSCEAFLRETMEIVHLERIPIRTTPAITNEPLIWRFFVTPLRSTLASMQIDEEECVTRAVMAINTRIKGAYVFSCGKNMGVFKAVGYPEDVGYFYRLEDYEAYSWTAHGRYPTNTPGWWGGAHPFALLNYSIVHNGEISSYDTNRRFIEMFGYKCTLQTDTEVITYIADYLLRKQKLSLEELASVIAAPFWSTIDRKPPQIELSMPVMFSAMSYGSISYNAHACLAQAAQELGICYNTGEGGLHEDFYAYGDNTIVQVASGRFGVHKQYLEAGAAVEIKMGQGAKPGIGGHLPGAKIVGDVSRTRMVPEGTDAISPAPHHDIYSIEDLRQLVYSLKEATEYKKPIIVKVAAVHNIAAIASGIARSGADIIAIDGFRGGTGAAPTRIRDTVGIPIELALAAVDQRLRDEGIRNHISLIASGSIRSSADVVKAIALGADACYIGTAALLALGCHLCRSCQTGRCNWGIATQNPELVSRLDIEEGKNRLVNLLTAWKHEIKEMMGGMGINSIEALKGNRLMLRGIGMTDKELEILGISHAGE